MNDLTEEVRTLLQERQVTELRTLADNLEFLAKVKENPWNVVPLFTEHLTQKTENEVPEFFATSEQLFLRICEAIQPDDVILVLIKEIEVISSDETLLILLNPLLKALLAVLGTKRVNYLAWSLNAVQVYLDEVPVPDNLNLEDSEKVMMDTDCDVERISFLYRDLIPFYESVHEKTKKIDSTDLKAILLRSYIQLLGKPLVFLDMDYADRKPKSRARIVAEFFIEKILDLDRNIYAFLDDDYIKNHEDVRIRLLSLGTLLYLCLGENIGIDILPVVYDHIYVFHNCLKFIVKLLEYDNQFCIEKGLKLAENLLKRASLLEFSYQLLDSPYHCQFCKNLSKVIIYNPVEAYRKQALHMFKNYLYRFDARGRYLLIYNIRKTINNTSLNAYVTTQYKEMMVEQLDVQLEISEYYRGPKLRSLLEKFCHLPEGVESDLIKDADQIIAALNLIRYLALRDKQNVTNFWDFVSLLEKKFLEPLKKALELSRAHYEVRLKDITEENARGDKRDNDGKVSVSIGGENLPEMTCGEKVKVINSSLTAFDVMESLLCRVNECLQL